MPASDIPKIHTWDRLKHGMPTQNFGQFEVFFCVCRMAKSDVSMSMFLIQARFNSSVQADSGGESDHAGGQFSDEKGK